MIELELKYLSVYAVPVGKTVEIKFDSIRGGHLDIDNEVKSIFLSSFNGKLPKSHKLQPFHFSFENDKRKNEVRDNLIKCISVTSDNDKDKIVKELAGRLSKQIDNRTGQVLFCLAHGSIGKNQRFALWCLPHDEPIQLQTKDGRPRVSEIKNAFSRNSSLRKACYLEYLSDTIGRNDLIRGILVDSTAGKGKLISDYWLDHFLKGTIEILKTRGTNEIIKYLKKAQEKAITPAERDSVSAAFYSLRSGSLKNTTLNDFGTILVGKPKIVYNDSIPKSVEANARFEIDPEEVKSKIKKNHIMLKNGIEVVFPLEKDIDPDDFIIVEEDMTYFEIREEIDKSYYR